MTRKPKNKEMERAYMPLYIGRYFRKTRRFRDRHHGAYLMILMTLWEEGGSLPHDLEELRGLACSDPRTWPATWAKIAPFFTIKDGRVSHHFVTELLESFDEKRRSQVAGGKRSGAIHAEKQREIKARGRAKPGVSSSSKAKGFAPPSYEGEGQSLPERYREEFERILSAPHLVRRVRPESLQAVRDALVEFDGVTFKVSEACTDRQDWELICAQIEAWRYAIELAEQRTLRLVVNGGEST